MKKCSFILVFLSLIFFSCASTKVRISSPFPNGLRMDSINLMSVMIGPVWQPVLPLIDAAAFNEKTNKISDQILDEEQKIVEKYKTFLVSELKGKFSTKVFTVNSFAQELTKQYQAPNGIQIENKNFPIVFFGSGDVNLVDFGNGKNINRMFRDNVSLKANVSKFAHELKVNNVVLCFNRLAVIQAGMFGMNGTLRLESYLFIYNSRGEIMIDVTGTMKPVNIKGKEVSDYMLQLNAFEELTQLISEKLAGYIK